MNTKFEYKPYSPQYRQQVLDLLGRYLWNFDAAQREGYFKWKFEDNPYTDTPLGFVALDGDKVVAFRGYMVQPLLLNGKEYLEASLADTVTDSNYRRMGLFKGVTKFSIDNIIASNTIIASLNSSSGGPTLNGYLSLGWEILNNRGDTMRFSLKGLLGHHKNLPDGDFTIHKNSCEITSRCKPKQMASIALAENRKDIININKDSKFYTWRLANPIARFIYSYSYNSDNEIIAFAVFKQISQGKYDLIDYGCRNNKALKKAIDAFVKTAFPIYIIHWITNVNSPIKAGRFGFINTAWVLNRFKKFRKQPFLIKIIGEPLISDMVNPYKWNLTKIIGDEI